MSREINGVTVGTTTSPDYMEKEIKPVKTVNNTPPDENGNVNVPGGNAEPMKCLQIDSRKLIGFNLHGVYDGTQTTMATVPTGFTFIEPSEYNPIPNDLYFHLQNMPAVLHGTFKATVSAETEYNFEYAYAFSGGFSNANYHITDCVVIEPATGKIYRFAYTDENTCTVTESTIGESGGDAPSGGGGEYRLARTITLESDVSQINITTDDDGTPLNLNEGLIEWVNPKTTANVNSYFVLTDGEITTPQIAFGNAGSNTIDFKAFWFFKRIAGKLMMQLASSTTNALSLSDTTLPSLVDIGNITGITMKTDGRALMMTGATLNLYVKE